MHLFCLANELSDMPAGKEKTDRLQMPIGLSTENDGKQRLLIICTRNDANLLPVLQRY
jgi:hypothetical protein